MNKIIILPEEVSNKIAAGEVVERPANIVKELLENSIDAKATYIDIEIEDAGKKLIRITDNGTGMSIQDALLSIKRYATSKISSFEDLAKLSTLGFRGEALASISGVSKLAITTKQKGTASAWKVECEGGKVTSKKECSHPEGTTMEVRDLFFNTPARKKFIKSNVTEQSHIYRTIEEIALAHTETGFSVKINNKNTLVAPPSKKLDERIADILGTGMHDSLIPVNSHNDYINITGFVSSISETSFSNSNNLQYFFVNGHAVSNRLISQTIYDAFQDSLPIGRHPTTIMLLEIDPNYIDINVHPTKKLIKFSEDRKVRDTLYQAVRNAITKQKPDSPRILSDEKSTPQDSKEHQHTLSFYNTGFSAKQQQDYIKENRDSFNDNDVSIFGEYRMLGQLHDTYILLGTPEGLVIIDQHAANERVLYEKFLKAAENDKHNVQPLLVPITMEFAPHAIEVLKNHFKDINSFGFEVSGFGLNTLVLKALPATLKHLKNIKDFFEELFRLLIDELKEHKITTLEAREKIIRAACRAAVKASDRLSLEETIGLFEQLKKCSQPLCCPHGRPTVIKITATELQRKFQRI